MSKFLVRENELRRTCPICGKDIFYCTKSELKRAIQKNRKCRRCYLKNSTIIVNKNELYRKCPICEKIIFYSSKKLLKRAEKENRLCNSCKISGKRNHFYGKHHTNESKNKSAIKHVGKKMSIQHRINTSKNNSKYWLGKKRDEKSRYNMRISAIKRHKEWGTRFNPNGCKFIDNLNNIMGLHLQHAKNGGEIVLYGYFIDGYDKEKNIIFEYDEPRHYKVSGELKDKDIKRQNCLIKEIKPILFLRYDEKNKKLYDADTKSVIPILL